MPASSVMKLPRNYVTSVPDTLATLLGAKPHQRSQPWKNSALALIWRPMTCWSPRPFGGRCPSASPCRWCRSAVSTSYKALPVSLSALNVEGLWNGNTSPTATAVGNVWIGVSSPKQPLSCLTSDSLWCIPAYPASVLYPLAAFGMSFSPPSIFLHLPIDFLFADFLYLIDNKIECLCTETPLKHNRINIYAYWLIIISGYMPWLFHNTKLLIHALFPMHVFYHLYILYTGFFNFPTNQKKYFWFFCEF